MIRGKNRILTALTLSILMLLTGCAGAPVSGGKTEEGSAQAAPSAEEEAGMTLDREGYSLDQVLILSRHNIRSPLSGPGSVLDTLTPHEWFAWSSDPSDLSLRGGVLETEMGQYFRKWLEEEGLFPEDYQPAEGEVRIYANSKQRTIATANYFKAGLLPVNGTEVEYHMEFDTMDPVFTPQFTYMSDEYRKKAAAQMEALYQEEAGQLEESYALLSRVIDLEESEDYQSGAFPGFAMDDLEFVLEEGAEPGLKGSLKTATSISDALVLQYYEADDQAAAFGKDLTWEEWKKVSGVKDIYGHILFTAPLVSVHVAHPLLREIETELSNKGRKFTFLCGHDSNICSVLAALSVEEYSLPGAIEKETPIGSKLVLTRWSGSDGHSYMGLDLVYQTTNQLRGLSLLDENNPPAVMHLQLEGLKEAAEGLYDAEDFRIRLREAIEGFYDITGADIEAEETGEETGEYPLPAAAAGRYEEEADYLGPLYSYYLRSSHEVDGRQGIAWEDGNYYVSGSASLSVYDGNWNLVRTAQDPFAGFEKEVNHIGDIDAYQGEIYAGVEYFMDGQAKNIQIAVYDAETLEMKRSFPFAEESGCREVSGIAVDPENGLIWMCSWADGESGKYLYRYDMKDGAYLGRVLLQTPPQWIQGIACNEGWIYISADDGVADNGEADHIYRCRADREAASVPVLIERTLDDVTLQGEIEGLSFDRQYGQLLVSYNRGARIVLGMPKGFYQGYDREIHEVFVYDRTRQARYGRR